MSSFAHALVDQTNTDNDVRAIDKLIQESYKDRLYQQNLIARV